MNILTKLNSTASGDHTYILELSEEEATQLRIAAAIDTYSGFEIMNELHSLLHRAIEGKF